MGNIYLVRHGQDEDNAEGLLNGHRDRPLTELGRQQAAIVAEKLRANAIDVIYSSPLQRAKATADTIGKAIDKPVEVLPDLIERDFGVLTGKPAIDIPKYSQKTLQTEVVNYFLEAEGAEDFPTLLRRAKKILAYVQSRHPKENVLLVAHGDIGKMIRAAYHNWDWLKALKTPYFDNTHILDLMSDKDVVE